MRDLQGRDAVGWTRREGVRVEGETGRKAAEGGVGGDESGPRFGWKAVRKEDIDGGLADRMGTSVNFTAQAKMF